MNDITSFFGSTFGILVILFITLIVILWTLLPFAIFGIKGKLDELISINRLIHDEMVNLNKDVSSLAEDQSASPVENIATLHQNVEDTTHQNTAEQVCPNCGQKNNRKMTNCTQCGHNLRS
ncbi:MAG: hypothetical protein ABFS32_14390 [Bacteroidota bacterium]